MPSIISSNNYNFYFFLFDNSNNIFDPRIFIRKTIQIVIVVSDLKYWFQYFLNIWKIKILLP